LSPALGIGAFCETTILRSIRDVLLGLPDHTVVHAGHGHTTTIGDERGVSSPAPPISASDRPRCTEYILTRVEG